MPRKLTQAEVSTTRILHSGAWEVAAVVDGRRKFRVFYGYTKREAIRLFVSDINTSRDPWDITFRSVTGRSLTKKGDA